MLALALNPAQKAAVEHDHGPLLVLAGAGSGKTRVVTQRIARLLEKGVPARAILAMTFTNKAAGEMHERVMGLVGKRQGKDLLVSTFHSFGLEVIRAETRALGLRGKRFAIFDQADSAGVVREILRNLRGDKNYDIGGILTRISAAKNAFVEPDDWQEGKTNARDAGDYDEIAKLCYGPYIEAMRSYQAFDFDDLICEVVRLWRRRPEVLSKWQERFRYVIVDEYQDTNQAQLELVRLLAAEHRNIAVVGDDDQSIYAWRGADVRNILEFEAHFPGAKVVKLEENYRSRQPILDVASVVLQKSTARRHDKKIVTTRPGGDKVQLVTATDPDVEASFVAAEAQRLIEREGKKPGDIAVLYRSNLQAPEIESALKEHQIPFRTFGGTQFYERKEVKDLIAYLRVSMDPHDELSVRRIVNYPARGIGPAALARLASHATAKGTTLWSAIERASEVLDLTPAAVDGCRDLTHVIGSIRARFERGETGGVVAQAVCDEIRLKSEIQAAATSLSAAARRWGNVESILRVFARRDEKGQGDRKSFAEFLRILALRDDGEDDAGGNNRMTLTTMHGAKGLEFDYVFIVGLEEGLLPHSRTQTERATDLPLADGSMSIDEERRLFYVSVTRARERLYLCRADRRGVRGKMMQRTPSRFLLEIPADLVEAREETGPVAPEATQTLAGAAGLLAALSGAAPGPPMRRPG